MILNQNIKFIVFSKLNQVRVEFYLEASLDNYIIIAKSLNFRPPILFKDILRLQGFREKNNISLYFLTQFKII